MNSLHHYEPPAPNMVMQTVVAEMNLQQQTNEAVELADNDNALEIEIEDGIKTVDL